LGLAIPQFGKGKYAIEQELIAEYRSEKGDEEYSQKFRGSWERYKRLKSTVDSFAREADELKATMRVGAEFEDGLEVPGDQFTMIRDVLLTLEIGKVQVEVLPTTPDEGSGN